MAKMNLIWHDKIEIPDCEEGLFVYVFDDGIDVEEYEEEFFFAENLIKWAKWEDVEKAIKAIEEIERLQKQFEIAVDCLKEYARKDLWEGFEYTPKWDLRHACYVDGGYSEAEETLQQIKELEK